MKKILTGIVLVMVLIGCGGIKKYSRKEKVDILIKVVVNNDKKAEKEYHDISRKLRKAIEEGKTEYQIEESEWTILHQLMLRANRKGGLDKAKIDELMNVDINQYLSKPKEKKTDIIKVLKGTN